MQSAIQVQSKADEVLYAPGAEAPHRILLAEDDKEMRILLASVLRKAGYSVVEFDNGWELFTFIEPLMAYPKMTKVDLIISDIRMPGLTGMEILEGMKSFNGFPPMILITAFGDEQTHRASALMGAVAVFDKPFDIDELVAKVREILSCL